MSAAEPGLHRSGAFAYRPALDGLRTVAVYLVVAFHAGVDRFSAGFVGVDLFFVLSGFLVTSVMLAEHRSRGRIDLVRFYSRRVRRLLPAAVVTVVAIAAASLVFDPPLTRAGHLAAARSALLYVSNWYFVAEKTDYFAADADTNPYLHFWSLAVEEQFYIVFPVVLIGLLALARRRLAAVATGLVAITAVLVAVQLFWSGRDPVRGYYGTDARVYQLVAGAAVAVVFALPGTRRVAGTVAGRVVAPVAAAVGLAALVVVATDVLDVSLAARGLLAAVCSLVVIAAIDQRRGPVGWLLARPTLVQLGKVSYGTYLWHWPIIVYGRQVLDISAGQLAVMAGVGATAMAFMSFHLLETPVRVSASLARRNPQVVAAGVTASVLTAVLVIPPMLNSDRAPAVSAQSSPAGLRAVPSDSTADDPPAETIPPDLDLAAAAQERTGMFGCDDAEPAGCILASGNGPHVFVIGDSNAAMLMPMFVALADDHDLTLSATTAPGCTWQRGLGWEVEDRTLVDDCVAIREDVYSRVLPALRPDVVIGIHIARDDPARGLGARFIPLDAGLGDGDEAIAAATRATLDEIESLGARMVIVEPVPYTTFDTVHCLSGTDVVADCAFEATIEPTPTEQLYRAEAQQRPSTVAVDLDTVFCPGKPLCVPIVDGDLVYRDAFHVYPPYAVDVRGEVWERIAVPAALDPAP